MSSGVRFLKRAVWPFKPGTATLYQGFLRRSRGFSVIRERRLYREKSFEYHLLNCHTLTNGKSQSARVGRPRTLVKTVIFFMPEYNKHSSTYNQLAPQCLLTVPQLCIFRVFGGHLCVCAHVSVWVKGALVSCFL